MARHLEVERGCAGAVSFYGVRIGAFGEVGIAKRPLLSTMRRGRSRVMSPYRLLSPSGDEAGDHQLLAAKPRD